MKIIAWVVGSASVVIAVLMVNIGIADVSHDTESLIAVLFFLTGLICLSLTGK